MTSPAETEGRQRGDLRVDLKPGRLERLRDVAALLELSDSEIVRQCVDLALPKLLKKLRAAQVGSCRQNATPCVLLAAGDGLEVRALDAEPSLRVAVPESAAKTPPGADFWRQKPLPLPVPHPHPHTHEGEGNLGEGEHPSPEGVCQGEGSGEGVTRRQNAAKTPQSERAEFRAWLARYPLPLGEEAAWRAWRATRRQRPPLAEMLDTLEAHCTSPRWREGTIPNPGRYLREHRWQDDPRHMTAVLVDAKSRRSAAELRQLDADGERAAPVDLDPAPRLAALAGSLPDSVPGAARRATEIRSLAGLSLDQIEAGLAAIASGVAAEVLASRSALADEVERRARQALGHLRGRLPPDREAQELARWRVRFAAEAVGLPELSLFSTDAERGAT